MNKINQPSQQPIVALAICGAAFTSGSLALAFQVVCTRIAMQHFGSETTTISAIIAMALIGLAAGAYTVGKRVDSIDRIGHWIGGLFIFCSLWSLGIAECGRWLANSLDAHLNPGVQQIGLAQFSFAAITMLPINFCLGGVLPALVKRHGGGRTGGSGFSVVYAFETIGAAAGSFASAFWLIQSFGLTWTLRLCALVALVVGFGLWLLPRVSIQSDEHNELEKHTDGIPDWLQVWFLLVVGAVSFATLGIEVVWQRFFVVWFGSDTQSYAIVVTTFLIGISIGAFVSSLLKRFNIQSIRFYVLVLILIAFTLLVTTGLLSVGSNIWWPGGAGQWLSVSPLVSRAVLAVALMLVPTTLIGIGLPLAARIWTGKSKKIGRKIGEVYSVALAGNVLGVLVCGYCLVPGFGLRVTAIFLSSICLIGGLALAWLNSWIASGQAQRNLFSFRLMMFLAIGGWLLSIRMIGSGDYQLGLDNESGQWVTDFYSERSQHTVAVVHRRDDPERRKMLIDGVAIGESRGGVEQKQLLLAHLPFLVQQEPRERKVLTIGLGSGILAAELLSNRNTKSVCCVELLPAVVEAAEHFNGLNGDLLRQNNFQLVQSDGIQFLRKSKRSFDVIVSDAKSRPGHAGNIAFFTRDYYQMCETRLSDSGVFVQWISLKTSGPALEMILKTFAGVFPYGHLAIVAPDSVFAVGTKMPLQLDHEFIDQYLADAFSETWKQYDFNSFADVASFYWLDQHVVDQLYSNVQANTLELPSLERFALDSMATSTSKSAAQLAVVQSLIDFDLANGVEQSYWNSEPVGRLVDDEANLKSDLIRGRSAATEIIAANRILLESNENWLDESAARYRRALSYLPELTRQKSVAKLYRQLAESANRDGSDNLEFSALLNIKELKSATAADEFRLGSILSQTGQKEKSLAYFYAAIKRSPEHPVYRTGFGYCLLELKKFGQASSQFKRVLAIDESQAAARVGLGIAQLMTRQTRQGQENITRALMENPDLKGLLKSFGVNIEKF